MSNRKDVSNVIAKYLNVLDKNNIVYGCYIKIDDELLFSHNENMVFSSASMIKTFISGLVNSKDSVTITKEHLAVGDGILQNLTLPITLPTPDALMLMVALSDNTATNAIIEHLDGIATINWILAHYFKTARLNRSIGGKHALSEPYLPSQGLPTQIGIGVCSPYEHYIAMKQVCSIPNLYKLFMAQKDLRRLARPLQKDVTFLHKTGTAYGNKHDGGVIVLPDGKKLHIHLFSDGWQEIADNEHIAGEVFAGLTRKVLEGLGYDSLLLPRYNWLK